MQTVSQIIDGFGGPTEFGKVCGFDRNPGARGSDMRQRGSIPVIYWERVIAAASARGMDGVSYETLTKAHSRREAAPEAEARVA